MRIIKFSKLICPATLILSTVIFAGCGAEAPTPETKVADEVETAEVPLPAFTIVEKDIDANDARYRVQVEDTLPNEEECIAIFKKLTHYKEGPATRNAAVYFTRSGFSAMADAHAYVMFTKSDEAPKYVLQTASNERLREVEALTFDSIPNKQLVVELLDASGSKRFIYRKPSGAYFNVIMFGKGNYEIEAMKAGRGNGPDKIVLTRMEFDETFTYKEDETGTMIEVYNGENILLNTYKILKRG